MKIAKYIGDLIFDYECVVIPGLGGFISSEQSAVINKVTNQFSPPSKIIHFNIHLKANDGLLVNYVAKNESLSYKDAKQKVDKFALLCHRALKEGKRINFSKIGYIFLDANQNIVFKQDLTINYNADAFGLSSFVSPAIRRPNAEEQIKEVFTGKTKTDNSSSDTKKSNKPKRDRRVSSEGSASLKMPSRKKPSKIKQQLLFVVVILFAMSTYYVVNNRHSLMYYADRYKVSMPFLYSNPNDYFAANAGLLPLEKINISQAGWISSLFDSNNASSYQMENNTNKAENIVKPAIDNVYSDASEVSIIDKQENNIIIDEAVEEEIDIPKGETYIINPAKSEVEPEREIEIVKPKTIQYKSSLNDTYFIIAGSFKSRRNAERFVSQLTNDGFQALIADTNSYGMFRVAYMSFGEMAEAENRLIAVRRDTNPQAWILKK